MFNSVLTLLASAYAGFRRDQGAMMAGHLAFLGLLSLFPFFVFFTAVAGQLGSADDVQRTIELFLSYLPPEVADVLRKPIKDVIAGAPKGILTVTAVIALWTASSGLDAARLAVRRAFHWSRVQPALKRRLESTAIAALAPLLLIAAMSIQVIGPALWKLFGGEALIGAGVYSLWKALQIFVTPTMLFGILFVIYFVLSPTRIRPIALAPGALCAAIMWLASANGLSIYLRNLGDYESTYGNLAGTMVTLLFFFFLGIGFVFGAEVNAAATVRRRGGDLGTLTDPSAPDPQVAPDAQAMPDAAAQDAL
ncbi:MAG: YihY/virulence factor BrkB family protein [Pseudomonadota bacterium]